ncbi:hypothetical protein CERZMDRAFT_95144 [Cercospora zeae-maydis SCOH1-5]|uniref:Uncharacterized protein n=1 Tax=Cercospora zeae-maydis SCOH1-5 TaxID=717836 RepID=A0A6A6FMS7_9PEZI|nr:hypothetical protein CERZMDRAFT_95144 [Cercospora zeae-maydis SCOH1-5]
MTSPVTNLSWTAINQPRRRSMLESSPAPTRRPYARAAYVHIPTFPPSRDHWTTPARPLVLPTPPTTPAALTLPEPAFVPPRGPYYGQQHESSTVSLWRQRTLPHESMVPSDLAEYVRSVRRLDTVPMFRLSDLCNVHESPIAQTYVIDRLQTPGFAPYSIAAMLNSPESPEAPAPHADTSNPRFRDNFESDDADEVGFQPSSPLFTGPHPPIPPTTTLHVLSERRSSLVIGAMNMLSITRPSFPELAPGNNANDQAHVCATHYQSANHGSAGTSGQRQSIPEECGRY